MADNVTVDNGGGTDYEVATNELTGGEHAQVIQIIASDAATADDRVPASETDGLLVNLGANNDVSVTGTVTVDGSGVTQPVSHAALTELAGAIDTEMQVDVVGALPAGTNNIGDVDVLTLPALPAGNNNIGDVDIASLPNEGQQTMANSISVAVASNQSAVPVDGSGVTQPVSHAALTELAGAIDTEMQVDVVGALPAGDNNIGNVDVVTMPNVTLAAGTNNIGDVDVLSLPALPAGTNNIGDVDVLTVIPGTGATSLGKAEDAVHASGDSGVYVLAVRDTVPAAHSGTDGDYESLHISDEGGVWSAEVASSQGGTAVFRSIDLDETEEEVKATAGSLYGWWITNLATSTRFVKIYNATAANVVVGTTTPVMTLPVPGNSTDDVAANMAFSPGIRFDTAITVAATTGIADNDTGAPGANEVVINIFYK